VNGPHKPASAGPDIHERIRIEAAKVRALPGGDFSNAERWPALAALIAAASDCVEAATPAFVESDKKCVRTAAHT